MEEVKVNEMELNEDEQEIERIHKRNEMKRAINKKRKLLQDNKANLLETASKYLEIYGEDSQIVQVFATLIEIISSIESVIDVIVGVQTVELFMQDAIGVIDDCLNLSNLIFANESQEQTVKKSFFKRLKEKREIKRRAKNIKRNLINKVEEIRFNLSVSSSAMSGIMGVFNKFPNMVNKSFGKSMNTFTSANSKKKKKKGNTGPSSGILQIKKYVEEKNQEGSTNNDFDKPSNEKPSSGTPKNTGVGGL